MFYKFLWNEKPDQIKRTKIIQDYASDGLQMVDLTSFIQSLKLSWLKRLINKTTAWTTIAKQEHMDPYKLLLYGTAKLKKLRIQIQNTFWRDVLDSLIEFNKSLNLTPENIIREPLWYSDFTKFRTTIVL